MEYTGKHENDFTAHGYFEGVFVRYLRYFLDAHTAQLAPAKAAGYLDFLQANADSLWEAQDTEGRFGVHWGGRSVFESATTNLQTAAIDAFAAAQVRKTPSWPRSWANFNLL